MYAFQPLAQYLLEIRLEFLPCLVIGEALYADAKLRWLCYQCPRRPDALHLCALIP